MVDTPKNPRARARAGGDAGLLAETVADAVIRIDAQSRILYVNSSASRMFGYEPSEMVGQNLTLLMPERLRQRHHDSFTRYLATGRKHLDWRAVELVACHKSGREIPVEISFGESRDEGEPTFTGVVRDITERKRADAVRSALLQVAERAQAASDMPEVYAAISDVLRGVMGAKSFRIVLRDASSGALHVAYLAGEAMSPARTLPLVDGWTVEVIRTGEPLLSPESPGLPAGSGLGVPLKAGGKILGALVVRARPETGGYGEREKEILTFVARQAVAALERSRAREELQRTVSVLRATLDSTADGILVVDHEGRVVSFNQRFATLWRIPPAMMTMRDDAALLASSSASSTDPEQFLSKVRELYAQPEAEGFDVLEFKDGRIFERYSMPQRQGKEAKGRVWSFRDVTKSRDLERQLRQSHKLEAIGRLAGGVAQDFNNLLTVVTSRGELARKDLEPRGAATAAPRRDPGRRGAGDGPHPAAPRLQPWPGAGPDARDAAGRARVERAAAPGHGDGAARGAPRSRPTGRARDPGDPGLRRARGEPGSGGSAETEGNTGVPFHLMVTDVVMPDMSGPELTRRLARASPETRVLFVSGSAHRDDAPDAVLARDAAFLLKPFSPDAFARKVREALAGPRPATSRKDSAG